MVKKLILVILLGAMVFAPGTLSALWWQNNEIGISLNDYGRIRTYTEPADEKQAERISIIVGTGNDAVFDYKSDAEVVDSAMAAETPAFGDWEGSVTVDNAWSLAPPDVEVAHNVYGWNTGEFALVKYTVKNISTASMDAKIGLEFLNEINTSISGTYYVNVHYFADNGIVAATAPDTTIFVGIKLLSTPLTSLSSIEWFSGYSDSDSLLWANLNHTTIDDEFVSGADGPVTFLGGPSVTLAADETAEMWVAIAQGNDSTEMVTAMLAAEAKYNSDVLGTENELLLPTQVTLKQNYPNPFNPETVLEFSLPENDNVTLNVYDLQGKLVASPVEGQLPAGQHSAVFNGSNLASGMYFYRLSTSTGVETRKMLLLK